MESFDGFMELFRRWKAAKSDRKLSEILKNGPSHFQNLSTSDIGLVLSALLDDQTGLLRFLKDASDGDMQLSITSGFNLLNFIIKEFFCLLNQYADGIKKVCQSAIIVKCSQNAKAAAVHCFESLLELCPCSRELKLDETVKAFVDSLHLSNDNDRAKFFEALGSVAKYHPESISLSNFKKIFERLVNDFDEIFQRAKKRDDLQRRELKTHLKVLNHLLTNLAKYERPRNTDETSEYYEKVYQCIKQLSRIDLRQKLKYVSREAIALLGSHMSLFTDYIYVDALDDALFWPEILLKWTNLPDLQSRTVAFNASVVYYETMGTILKSTNTDSSRKIFQDLMQRFHDDFSTDKINPTTLQLSICGFGHMAGPCKNYLTEKDVSSMFSLIAERTFVMYPCNNETKFFLENIAYYQVTLSQIVTQLSNVSMDRLSTLSTLSLILIKRFPDLPVTSHSLVVSSLMETIQNISQACSRRLYGEFIQQLVYEGMIWSCSHTLFVDAEREREMENLDERPICYKNYLSLWQSLLCPDNVICTIINPKISLIIFENMIETCVKLINRLNLNVTTVDTSSETKAFDIPVALNDTDFRVFVNLVDLVVTIFEKLRPAFVRSKMNWFLCEMIRKSNKNPLISGFYKLIHVVLKLYNLSSDQGGQRLLSDTLRLLSHYLLDSIDRSSSFSGELQASCLSMIFEMPASIAENLLDDLVPTFKTAFSLGQSNFSLAQSALNALEKWSTKTEEERTKKFLIEVVPSLETFLQSNETAVELTVPNERKVIKNIVLTDHEKTLQEFQRKILLFFGSLNSEITSNFGAQLQSPNSVVLRDDKDLLEYTLLYKDIKPDIYLNTILPRTIELALNSTDRRTRVVACEVLHTIVIVMLGRKQLLVSNPDHLLPVFKKICPAVLRLGSDSDQVVHQLFYPLMMQLTRWYSSSTMFESSETDCLIEILFDSLTYESNMALSDFSGVCLAEFVKWSIDQSTDPELTNAAAIISKIINFAVHPSVRKRVGAAVAFNYLHTILRESDILIDIFCFELLVCFIKSLDGCNSAQILKSLKHIERILDNKYEILNKQSSRRRKPAEFKETLLQDAANWLIVQCGSLDRNCRSKSMELLRVISNHVNPVFSSVQEVFAEYVKRNGVRNLNRIILKDLFPKMASLSVEAMKPLLRTLDCYIWIIDDNLMSLDLLFTDKNVNRDMIFNCIINFIYLVNLKIERSEKLLEFTKQYQELCVIKCEIISKIFDFIRILLNKLEVPAGKNSSPYIPSFFWNDELYSLITKCIFEPEVIGFCLQNLEIIEALPSRVEQLLDRLIQNLDDTKLSRLRDSIAKAIESKYEDCFDLNTIFSNNTSYAYKSYLKGLTMLKTFHQFDKLYEKPLCNDYDSANKVSEIFNSLKREQDGQVVPVELESGEREYLENLLEFLFLKFEVNMVRTLVNIVGTKTELTLQDSTIISHEEYFINLFGVTVFRNLLKHMSKSMDTLLSDLLKDKFDTVLILLEDLLLYVKKNKKISEEYLSVLETEFVKRFSTFLSFTSHSGERKDRVINLYSLLVQLSQNPSKICSGPNELYFWIMGELSGPLDLEYKTRILNSFLPLIVDETVTKKKQGINDSLHKLKEDHYPTNINDLVKGTLKYSTVISSFETMSRHLSTLKSVTVFNCVIHLTIGNVECLWNDGSTKYLTAYFKEIDTDDSQTSLGILYKYFMNTENPKERLAILNKLLLECIHFCNAKAIEQFFELNVREIYETVSKDLFESESGLQKLIVSKIGGYNLLEIMFAKVSLEKLTSTDSTIVKNAIAAIETGKGLFQEVIMNVLNVRKLKCSNIESAELMRLLHCAAYNCSIAIVSLKCEERFYVLPFAENRMEDQLLWENIIDTNRRYEFTQDFTETPKECKKLINIRKQSAAPKQAHNYSHVESYNLDKSTLNKELRRLDSYESNLSSQSIGEIIDNEEMISLTFESDDLNNHECMAPICGLITHMVSRNIFNLANDDDVENSTMPKWMEQFHNSMNLKTNYNVKLFMIKIVVNMGVVFKPYAKFFLTPVLVFLNLHFQKYGSINYVIKDILVMLIDWHGIVIPTKDTEIRLAQKLLENLIKYGGSQQRHIYKDNVEIINMLVEVWHSCLEVPEGILQISDDFSKFKVCMILTFLSNNKAESLVSIGGVLDYLVKLFDDLDEEIVLYVCDAFGLILKFLESKNDSGAKEWIEKIENSVVAKSPKNRNKYIKYIHKIHKFYPNIINRCFERLTVNFSKLDNVNKSKYLELFLSAMPNFTDKKITSDLEYVKFRDILLNKIPECLIVALKIIEKLLNILKPSNYLPFAELIAQYSKDASIKQREIVMNIFIAVHRKYCSDNIDHDITVKKLKDLSRQILLMGLLETNECLQRKLLQFWTEEGNVADKSIERILQIFEMYDPNIEANYLPILPLMMLHLVSRDPGFDKKMFEPLANCEFKDYQIEVLGCSKDVGLVAPLFTSSLLNQMSQYYSQSNPTFARSISQSKQTQSANQSFLANFGSSAADVKQIPQPSKNKKSNRLVNNAADVRDSERYGQILINRRREEILKEKVDRQRNSIKIYRKYRNGDYPDTEINHSSLIIPLQELVKNDQVIARDLTVAIFRSMLKEISSDQKTEFLQKLSVSLKFILDKTQGSKSLIAAVLEIILYSYEICVSPNVIAKVSKSSGLLSLGALLLEEKMISGYTTEDSEPPTKRFKYENQRYDGEDDWLQLANIYKSMNDFDIVRTIFRSEKFGKELQEASFAQAASEWSTARVAYEKAYKKAYEMDEGLAKDYCQESLFVCLAHLSDWKQINRHVKADLKEDFNALWEKPINENWLTSWALQAQIYGMVRNEHDVQFLKALNDCRVNTKDTLTHLKSLYGEEMAIFYVNENPEFSENCLISGLEKIIQEWKHLNPLYYEQKINKYLKLRGLSDIKKYLKGIKEKTELIANVECMLTSWNNSVPANQDNLLLWGKHIVYRLYFIELLKKRFEVAGPNEILNMLNATVVKQCLNIAQVACAQWNPQFMDKCLRYSKPYLINGDESLTNEWKLAFSKHKYLSYFDSKTQEERREAYIASWEASHMLVKRNCVDSKVQIDVRQHISSLVIELQKLVTKSDPISKILLEHPSISIHLPPRNDQENFVKQSSDYCLTNLKACYESGPSEDKASCYFKVSTYCHFMGSDFDTGLDLSEEFIHSTLSAMRYGSLEASQYFPCLLHLDYSKDPELGRKFEATSKDVETWMFLKWQAQLLSHIGTPTMSFINPVLLKLSETYPNSFVYAFRMAKEMNKSLSGHPIVSKLTQILSGNKDLDLFLEAMKYVVQPEYFLKYYVSELGPSTVPGSVAALKTLLTILYPTKKGDEKSLLQGKVYKVIEKFEAPVKEIPCKQGREWFFEKKEILNKLDKLLRERITGTCKLSLEDYSPWLHKFSGGNIEIPGQYAGDKKPTPQYHIKIVKLNPIVTILPSLRKPIKLTMLGNDGKNYSFLVKFGEDLRTDERIEQLFTLMNRILQGDAVCRQPQQLSIDTYPVIPLTGSLGLIQWIDNTKSLNEIIKSVLTDEEEKEREKIKDTYMTWMRNDSYGKSYAEIFKEAVIRYDRQEVTAKFNELRSEIDWDVLRRAFQRVSSSPESFFAIRHNFITSYATMCIAQWILGIGDRNLENILISYTSGKVLGIDFGYSFDSSIDISSVPELMPFRLTPQILGLLLPFDENGLLKITMINVLRALKHAKDPLLACMDIFIKEPLIDWLAKKKTQQEDQQGNSDVKWYPKKKINIVVDKLNGVKPSKLTLLQLKDRYGNTECYRKLIDIVNGSDGDRQLRVRSERKDENLSIEGQVECLLDQATDPNILARAWVGWQPWI